MGYIKRLLREYRIKQLKKQLAKEVTAEVSLALGSIIISSAWACLYFTDNERKSFILPIDASKAQVEEKLNEARRLYVSRKGLELEKREMCKALNERVK